MIEDLLERIRLWNERQTLCQLDNNPKFISNPATALNFELMYEELHEYSDACRDQNMVELADSLGDMFFVLWGMVCKHGMQDIFFEKILFPICESNETKFCGSLNEVIESQQAYKKKNIDVTFVEWGNQYVIVNARSNKVLKGINYKEPVIEI